jgi:glucosamine kinase
MWTTARFMALWIGSLVAPGAASNRQQKVERHAIERKASTFLWAVLPVPDRTGHGAQDVGFRLKARRRAEGKKPVMPAAGPFAAGTISTGPGATNAPQWFVGVDGGATRCRARIRDAGGVVLAEADGGAANIYVDFASAVSVMCSVVGQALRKAGIGARDSAGVAVGLGLAGLNDAADVARVAEAFAGYALARVGNDATTACIGAHGGADGGLVIAGTGSAAIARVAGAETIVGGRGSALGDSGSGAHIGLGALRAATLAFDGLGPQTGLTDEILNAFDRDIVRMVRWARAAKPGDFGSFAPRVFRCAARADPVALAIAASAATAVGALTRRVVALGAQRIALVGGVGEALRPYLDHDVAALLERPLYDATDGAILMAGGAVATGKEAAQ